MAVELVGREEELGFLIAFLDRTAEGPAALVLEGEAGIGKSALWLAGVRTARERRFRVLSTRPAEAEQSLGHAGLGDLLEDDLDEVLPALAAPRRRALEIALLVEEAGTHPPDPRTLAVAVRTAVRLLAETGPLLVAIDDVQWLDPSSEHALAFALRRLSNERVLVLLTRRLDERAEVSGLEHTLDAERVQRVHVGPLSLGAVQRVVQVRLGEVFARPTLLRLHETSGGNPLYALELARALLAHGAVGDPTQPLLVPETLEGLVRARLAELPDETRRALALATALGRPSTDQLSRAGVPADVLEAALDARVIDVTNRSIHFTHPLLASVLYQGLSARERRRTHALAAEVVDDEVSRARHLALASEGVNAEIAGALEAAADVARARGAIAAAAELGEHAVRLTPPGDEEDAHRRVVSAARAQLAAGEVERARVLAHDLAARTRAGPRRAEALVLLSELEAGGQLREAVAMLREALRETAAPPALRASIHQRLSLEARFTDGMQVAEEHGRAALELAERLDDDDLRSGALAALALVRFNAGKPRALELAEQAYGLVARADLRRQVDAGFCLVHILVWSAHLQRARALLDRLRQEWSTRDERVGADALWYLSLVELQAGRWPLAAEYAERAREVSVLYGRDDAEAPQNLFPIALAAAYQGDLDGAGDLAARARRLAEKHGALLPALAATQGLVEHWRGDEQAALTSFLAAERGAEDAEWGEPALYSWRADYVEALLECGRSDDATRVVDAWEAGALRLDRPWVTAQATRSRGLIAAADGDVEQARAMLEQAVEQHEGVGDPFGQARALLALGVVRRRARQKRPAREAIEAALAGFEALGAAGWAAKARAELGRIAGRKRETGLTAAERRVAELVAEGRTNREVAAALYLGERTVETHLTHVYAKLGVRSRTELARKLP